MSQGARVERLLLVTLLALLLGLLLLRPAGGGRPSLAALLAFGILLAVCVALYDRYRPGVAGSDRGAGGRSAVETPSGTIEEAPREDPAPD